MNETKSIPASAPNARQRRTQVGVQLDERTAELLCAEATAKHLPLAEIVRQHIARSLYGDLTTHHLAEIKVQLAKLALEQESMRNIDLREARDAIERRVVDLHRLSASTMDEISSLSKFTLSGLRALKDAVVTLTTLITEKST